MGCVICRDQRQKNQADVDPQGRSDQIFQNLEFPDNYDFISFRDLLIKARYI